MFAWTPRSEWVGALGAGGWVERRTVGRGASGATSGAEHTVGLRAGRPGMAVQAVTWARNRAAGPARTIAMPDPALLTTGPEGRARTTAGSPEGLAHRPLTARCTRTPCPAPP
ncbi:hypothetical protein GCM10023097_44590 [Streptomyces collinus]